MTLTLTILGCGSSAGVPRPALGWGACDPANPKNRRRRCSLLVERVSDRGVTRIVIDTSPDLREQLIDAAVDHIDAVFLTHEHADQTHGIDDLRSVVLHQRRRIPVFLNQSTADHVVLALPFTTLRDVEYRRAGFSRAKDAAIQQLGMGTNAKLTLQFSHKTWRRDGYDGYIETDLIPGDTWDTTVNQAGHEGIMVVYSGGRRGATYPTTRAHGPAPPAIARETVARLATIYPHLDRDFTGRAHLDAWVHNPWSHGSYAAFLVGQYTRFSQQVRAAREGGVHFAGEHTDTDQQGYIDGAVRTGERAARELLAG